MDILTGMRRWAETVTPNPTDHEVIVAVRKNYPGGVSGFIRSRVPAIYGAADVAGDRLTAED